jgi:hypothetical protein
MLGQRPLVHVPRACPEKKLDNFVRKRSELEIRNEIQNSFTETLAHCGHFLGVEMTRLIQKTMKIPNESQ